MVYSQKPQQSLKQESLFVNCENTIDGKKVVMLDWKSITRKPCSYVSNNSIDFFVSNQQHKMTYLSTTYILYLIYQCHQYNLEESTPLSINKYLSKTVISNNLC